VTGSGFGGASRGKHDIAEDVNFRSILAFAGGEFRVAPISPERVVPRRQRTRTGLGIGCHDRQQSCALQSIEPFRLANCERLRRAQLDDLESLAFRIPGSPGLVRVDRATCRSRVGTLRASSSDISAMI
jgi:hypothetical protein